MNKNDLDKVAGIFEQQGYWFDGWTVYEGSSDKSETFETMFINDEKKDRFVLSAIIDKPEFDFRIKDNYDEQNKTFKANWEELTCPEEDFVISEGTFMYGIIGHSLGLDELSNRESISSEEYKNRLIQSSLLKDKQVAAMWENIQLTQGCIETDAKFKERVVEAIKQKEFEGNEIINDGLDWNSNSWNIRFKKKGSEYNGYEVPANFGLQMNWNLAGNKLMFGDVQEFFLNYENCSKIECSSVIALKFEKLYPASFHVFRNQSFITKGNINVEIQASLGMITSKTNKGDYSMLIGYDVKGNELFRCCDILNEL